MLYLNSSQIERNNVLLTSVRAVLVDIGNTDWAQQGLYKNDCGKYYPVWLEQAMLASCLLNSPLIWQLLKAKICMAYERNGLYGKISSKREPIKIWKKIVPLYGPHNQLTTENKELMGQEWFYVTNKP